MGSPALVVVAQTKNWRWREIVEGEFVASQSPVTHNEDIESICEACRAGRIQATR